MITKFEFLKANFSVTVFLFMNIYLYLKKEEERNNYLFFEKLRTLILVIPQYSANETCYLSKKNHINMKVIFVINSFQALKTIFKFF